MAKFPSDIINREEITATGQPYEFHAFVIY